MALLDVLATACPDGQVHGGAGGGAVLARDDQSALRRRAAAGVDALPGQFRGGAAGPPALVPGQDQVQLPGRGQLSGDIQRGGGVAAVPAVDGHGARRLGHGRRRR